MKRKLLNTKLLNTKWLTMGVISAIVVATMLVVGMPLTADAASPVNLGGKSVSYFKGSKAKGYYVQPTTKGKHPAMVMIHEWWGLTEDIKEIADRYAKEGYVVLAVDLYEGKAGNTPDEARKLAGSVRNNLKPAFANLSAAVKYLQKKTGVDKKRIASIGWCFGGGWAYQMAKNEMGVKVSVMYYGQMNASDDFESMKASIIGHFAENDRGIKVDDVLQFQAGLKTASGVHQIYIYPNTTHGFASRERTNKNFSVEAAKLAWDRTQKFLKENL